MAFHFLMFCSHPVVYNSLWPHGQQHTRPPCSSPSPKVCPSSYLLHQWCHPAISSSDTLFSFCPQSFPASGTFPMSQRFPSGGQSIGASASAPVLPMNSQGGFPLRWAGVISIKRRFSHKHLYFSLSFSAQFHYVSWVEGFLFLSCLVLHEIFQYAVLFFLYFGNILADNNS